MIEKEKLYKIIEYLLDKKRTLIGTILLILLYCIFKSRTSIDFLFIIPIILFYELLILIINYTNQNLIILIAELTGITISTILSPWIPYANYVTIAFLILFSYRHLFKFFLIIEPNGWKKFLDYYYLSLKYSPFLIHRYKDELIQFLKNRDLNSNKD